MFNDQVMQRRSLHFQAELEQQRASALLDSYTAQRRLTHEFTNHISALRALLAQGDAVSYTHLAARLSGGYFFRHVRPPKNAGGAPQPYHQ